MFLVDYTVNATKEQRGSATVGRSSVSVHRTGQQNGVTEFIHDGWVHGADIRFLDRMESCA